MQQPNWLVPSRSQDESSWLTTGGRVHPAWRRATICLTGEVNAARQAQGLKPLSVFTLIQTLSLGVEHSAAYRARLRVLMAQYKGESSPKSS